MFSTLCNVHADTSKVASTISPRRGYAGLQFYRQQFSIILMFGLTELQAQLSWKEDVSTSRDLALGDVILTCQTCRESNKGEGRTALVHDINCIHAKQVTGYCRFRPSRRSRLKCCRVYHFFDVPFPASYAEHPYIQGICISSISTAFCTSVPCISRYYTPVLSLRSSKERKVVF